MIVAVHERYAIGEGQGRQRHRKLGVLRQRGRRQRDRTGQCDAMQHEAVEAVQRDMKQLKQYSAALRAVMHNVAHDWAALVEGLWPQHSLVSQPAGQQCASAMCLAGAA